MHKTEGGEGMEESNEVERDRVGVAAETIPRLGLLLTPGNRLPQGLAPKWVEATAEVVEMLQEEGKKAEERVAATAQQVAGREGVVAVEKMLRLVAVAKQQPE